MPLFNEIYYLFFQEDISYVTKRIHNRSRMSQLILSFFHKVYMIYKVSGPALA